MQVINGIQLQHLPADVDAFNAQLREAFFFTIQALCAAGPRKVASRTDIFQGAYSSHPGYLLYTLTCFGAEKRKGYIQ